MHVLTAGWDQFVTNVIKQEGQLHQVLRDLLFMIPDILHIVIAIFQLFQLAKIKKRPPTHLISNEQFFGSVLLVSGLWIVCLVLWSHLRSNAWIYSIHIDKPYEIDNLKQYVYIQERIMTSGPPP